MTPRFHPPALSLSALLLLVGVLLTLPAETRAQQAPPPDAQIRAAVQAAPPALRDSARVLGYEQGSDALTELRTGDGPMLCLADDPADDGFHVACYHEALEPFMARGRQLKAEGHETAAADSVRRAEIASGALAFPREPTALYSVSGPAGSFSPDSGFVKGVRRLHVLYTPFATAASTGLPTSAETGEPWIMEGGQPWAHVMIFPPDTSAAE